MPMIEVADGVRVFAQDWGSGRPIVFLHGWPFSHRIFEDQMTALAARGFRTVGIDLRGFGASDKPWRGCDYDGWASDLHEVVNALGLDEVLLVGFSMGGAIAAHYVATFADPRVSALALVGAAAPSAVATAGFPDGPPRDLFDGFLRALDADQPAFVRHFVAGAFHAPMSEEKLRFYEAMGTRASRRACARGLEELRDRDLGAELRAIALPTCILHGVNDRVVPFAAARAQERLIPGATLVPFPHGGHGLFHDERERLTEELERFAWLGVPELAPAAPPP